MAQHLWGRTDSGSGPGLHSPGHRSVICRGEEARGGTRRHCVADPTQPAHLGCAVGWEAHLQGRSWGVCTCARWGLLQ